MIQPALALLAAGCAEELGPETFRTTNVHGSILEGGRIVVRGWIEFHPFGGTVGSIRVAPIRADGSYEATGVAVGRNIIQVDQAATDANGNARPFREPLCAREIPDGPSTTLNLDILEEKIRQDQARARQR